MKTKVLFLVALIGVILLSCGHDSGHLIGSFKVLKKQKSNPYQDYGFITLYSQQNDTLTMLISAEEEYLNIKIGDAYMVGRNRYGSLFLNDGWEKGIIGYCKILKKKIDMGVPKYQVITRGQDTIVVDLVSEVVYYNTSEGDSVFVKKNRGSRPYYFVE